MTVDQTWVNLAPTVDPIVAALRTGTGKTVTFTRAPGGGDPAKAVPPFSVLLLISDPRIILTIDGGQPAEVTWQLESFGETPTQALALGDKGARVMSVDAPPALPGALVVARETVNDGGVQTVVDKRYLRQQRFRWTLIGAVSE